MEFPHAEFRRWIPRRHDRERYGRLAALLSSQFANPRIDYHHFPVAPSEDKLSGLIAHLRGKSWPGAEMPVAG